MTANAAPRMGDGASLPVESPERQPSKILPALFAGLDPSRPLNVLDLGPALPESLTFFSRLRCRLHFVDFYGEPVLEQQHELSDWDIKVAFGKLLNFRSGYRIDIVLFWDFLNYLDAPALRAFAAALRPWLHAESRAHGFAVRAADTWLPEQQYGIVDIDTVNVRPAGPRPKRNHPHTQRELNDAMPGFKVNRGTLLGDGRVELLLETR